MRKKAFTLFEMIIVVALIGIIYTIVLTNFNSKKDIKISKIEDLKKILLPLHKKGMKLTFYLFDNYQKSALFINNELQESYKPKIELSEFKQIEVYNLDHTGDLIKKDFTPILIDNKAKKIDFSFTIYPNGSSSNYIIKKGNIFYIFYPYFKDVNMTLDEDEAKDLFSLKEYRGVTYEDAKQ